MKRATIVLILAMLAVTVSVAPFSNASDALLDAKRDAAAKLLKDGKSAEAQKLYEEVVAQDASTWSDHYALAKLHDKSGDTAKAVEAYRLTAKLLKNNTRTAAERTALSDAEKRTKVLDETSQKIDALVEDLVKQVNALGKEAEKEKNVRAIERLRKLQLAAVQAGARNVRVIIIVDARTDWHDTGIDVEPGDEFEFAARGNWSVKKGESKPVGPDGAGAAVPPATAAYGMLIGRVGISEPFGVGSAKRWQATESGRLQFAINDSGRYDNEGSMEIAIVRK